MRAASELAAGHIFNRCHSRPDPNRNPDTLMDYVYGHIGLLKTQAYQSMLFAQGLERLFPPVQALLHPVEKLEHHKRSFLFGQQEEDVRGRPRTPLDSSPRCSLQCGGHVDNSLDVRDKGGLSLTTAASWLGEKEEHENAKYMKSTKLYPAACLSDSKRNSPTERAMNVGVWRR